MIKKYKKTNLDIFFKKNKKNYFNLYSEYLLKVLNSVSKKKIDTLIRKLLEARKKNKFIFVAGNGGSASTADHFAIDLMISCNGTSKPLRCISLNSNLAVVTALANDFNYEFIFYKQLEFLAQKGDIFISISASGNSKNLINAINFAKKKSIYTVGLTSFNGGKISKISDLNINFKSEIDEYGPAEDSHLVLNHVISTFINKSLTKKK